MEITSFVLGMLTIVAVLIVTAIVVGMVKIVRLEKQNELLKQLCAAVESDLRHEITNVYDNMSREGEGIRRIIEDTNRDITLVERTIMNRIDQTRQEWDRAIDETHKAMGELSHSDRRYIDSRIDKVVVKGTIEGSKQVIKG
jgi:biopolymer transport protein ExbB/TolQ